MQLNGFINGHDHEESSIYCHNGSQSSKLAINSESENGHEKESLMKAVIASYYATLVEHSKHHLGYPCNMDFDYKSLLHLQQFCINNVGDPFQETTTYGLHSMKFEVEVLDWFAHLWDIEKSEYWGYVTHCGTEGNFHGLLIGRELFPHGVLYTSKESHYSIFKAARLFRMEVVQIETHLSGEIDCNDLRCNLMTRKDRPAILNVNIGTTMKGAVDDLDLVIKTLSEVGFDEDNFYIHCDGALFGVMIPFVKKAPMLSFKKPIGSVSVSGHKFVGCPMPCGVQITRSKYMKKLSRDVEYIASKDATIMGSRNGHVPILLWYVLNKKGYRGFQNDVESCISNANYLKQKLMEVGIGVMLNELSNTVVFERPKDEAFVLKWQLACQGSIAHAVVMPNINKEKLDAFVKDFIQSQLHCSPNGNLIPPCIAHEVGTVNCACNICTRKISNYMDKD